MAPPQNGDEMRIGEVLKRARTRQGIEIASVEERTKIRTKYLRALEAEDWEVLPSSAYAKGFLRTYAQVLGLDADAIVEQFRLQVESQLEPGNPLRVGEPVLEGRRRAGERSPGRSGAAGLVLIGVLAAIGILLLVGLIGGDDEGDQNGRPAASKKQGRGEGRKQGERKGGGAPAPPSEEPQSVELALSVRDDVQVCLLGGGGEVLIDGQVLGAGSEERFTEPRFALRFPSGFDRSQFRLVVNGKATRLDEVLGPAAFRIAPGEPPRQVRPPGTECP